MRFEAKSAVPEAAAEGDVTVLQQVQIDSLQVTILRGGGAAVARWAAKQGFDLSKDAPGVLRFYSRRSPYFMAAKFDASAAAAKGFKGGDGIPVDLTIPTREPWVPVRILATAKPGNENVNADVFLLTDKKPALLHGAGLTTSQRSETASPLLLSDLRSDKNSTWVPQQSWLTYVRIDTPARNLTYDLAIDAQGRTPARGHGGVERGRARCLGARPRGASAGVPWAAWLVVGLGSRAILAGLIALTGTGRIHARARRTPGSSR